ncbi:MAG: hypothetical protein AB7Q29_00615 [Vicinamibacterales bacterium]
MCRLLVAALLALAPAARAQEVSSTPVIVLEDRGETSLDRLLDPTGAGASQVAARVAATQVARLDALAARNVRLWLTIEVPATLDAVEVWREGLQALLARISTQIAVVELDVSDRSPDVAAFAIRFASTETRALAADAQVAVGGRAMSTSTSREAFYTADVAPYIDLLVVDAGAADETAEWLDVHDPGARVAAVVPREAADSAPGATRDRASGLVSDLFRLAGGSVQTVIMPASDAVPDALRVLAAMPPLLAREVSAMDDAGSGLTITRAGTDVTSRLRHRLLLDERNFATYLTLPGGTDAPLDVSVRLAVDAQPVIYDAATGRRSAAQAVSWDAASRVVRLRVPPSPAPLLIDFNRGADVIGDRSQVVGSRRLSVEEIIARHQVVQRRQDLRVRNYMASAETAQHFRPNVADAGFDVVTENRYFVAGDDIEWEERSFSVNGARWGADRPPLPLLQPEKVLSLPLQLRFGSGYRYELDGEGRVNGYDCYAIRFEPVRDDVPLYRGTVWIDRRTFARIRVQAVQRGLRPPVVSNEETQEYAPPVVVGGQPLFLLNALTSRQLVMVAGRNVLVEKFVRFSDVRVNDPQFGAELAAARASDRIMYRETDAGLRYLVQRGGERVVSERPTESVKALAMGVYVDPSYAFPLPIFGLNYLDFAFRGPDTQLAVLFGGVLAAGNIQRPRVGATPFDASVDFFGIAVPSTDRIYAPDGERVNERVLTWPLSTGLNLGWQYTPFQKLIGQYQFRFDAYVRDPSVSGAFTPPTSTLTNGVGASWEYRRGGYVLVASDTEYRRARWGAWGTDVDPTAVSAPGGSYAKHQVNLSRDWYFRTFHKLHLNAGYFGGRGLDRFSKYQFGMFDDTRIHGVPASGVRFAKIGMVRGSYTLNVFDVYRVDLFAEQAWGLDRPDPWQSITGLGAAVNFRAPKSTILRAEFGKSLLPDRFRSVGSYTLQILVLKPLR